LPKGVSWKNDEANSLAILTSVRSTHVISGKIKFPSRCADGRVEQHPTNAAERRGNSLAILTTNAMKKIIHKIGQKIRNYF